MGWIPAGQRRPTSGKTIIHNNDGICMDRTRQISAGTTMAASKALSMRIKCRASSTSTFDSSPKAFSFHVSISRYGSLGVADRSVFFLRYPQIASPSGAFERRNFQGIEERCCREKEALATWVAGGWQSFPVGAHTDPGGQRYLPSRKKPWKE